MEAKRQIAVEMEWERNFNFHWKSIVYDGIEHCVVSLGIFGGSKTKFIRKEEHSKWRATNTEHYSSTLSVSYISTII